jgi:hypothetical protein
MHAVDGLPGKLSAEAEFLRVAGFTRTGSRVRFEVTTDAEVTALVRFDKDLARFERAGDYAAQWRLNRSLALSTRPIRVPTMQSIRGPAEAFAEIGSHLILDQKARQYLPHDLTTYFDAHVFIRQGPE